MTQSPISHLIIGADHAGFALKEYLKPWLAHQNIAITDVGCYDEQAVDYPQVSQQVVQAMQAQPEAMGLIICGSGAGVAIAANRYKGIRAVVAHDVTVAQLAREHNDCNVLCLGARIVAPAMAQRIVAVWLETAFEADRHQPRVCLLDTL